jgi:hypothetical protein
MEKYARQVEQNKTGRFFCAECRQSSGVGTKPRTVPPRTCEWCGGEFISYAQGEGRARGRFCSKEHYDAWQKRNRVERVCEWCGETFDVPPSYETRGPARFCSRAHEAAARVKRPLDREHNGKPAVLDSSGYVRIYEPTHPAAYKNGWVLEHRLVAERTIGRMLTSDEHVHHINGVKTDNRPENLQMLGHSEHSSLTAQARSVKQAALEADLAEYQRRFGPLGEEPRS